MRSVITNCSTPTWRRYREIERLGVFRRILVGLSRISESEDDELAYAYHAANQTGEPYNRKECVRAYTSRAYGFLPAAPCRARYHPDLQSRWVKAAR